MYLVDLFCIDERNCTSLPVTENKSGFILFSVKNKNRKKKIRNINKSLENVIRHNQNNKTLCAFESVMKMTINMGIKTTSAVLLVEH